MEWLFTWTNQHQKALLGYTPVGDRIFTMISPRNVTIIQIYAPTSGEEEEEVED